MKLGIKDRFKVLLTGSISDHNRAFLSGADIRNTDNVDTDTAMKYSAVAACVRVRAETMASLPAILYKKIKDGREPKTDLTIYDVLHGAPNEEMSPFSFKETMMTNFDVSGNVVCGRLLNKDGEIVGLYPYHHSLVTIDRNKETKKLEYKIKNGTQETTLRRDQVLHVPNMSFDGIIGLSPITCAARAINLGLSYEQYGVNFYRNAAMPSGVFEHPAHMSDDAYARLKKDLNTNYTGLANSGTPMLLEEGMKWNQVTVNPIDAQLLESKYFQIEDIARIYRVPQHMINKLDRSTNNNIEHQSLEFVMYCILPICKRFEDAINSQLLTSKQRKDGYYIEFKIDGLLRGDAKSRAEAYSIGRLGGWLSVNDIRRLENMPSIGPSGDIYLQPLNYGQAGNISEQTSAQNKMLDDIYSMIKERGGKE